MTKALSLSGGGARGSFQMGAINVFTPASGSVPISSWELLSAQ